jgi:predicted enzyme related to lactoylglutathione lyase
MTQRNGYIDGAPCWADLSTPDLEGAKRFYAALLGWSFDEARSPRWATTPPPACTAARSPPSPPSMPGMDMPTVWSVYLKSSDLDATSKRFSATGGNMLVPPMEIPGEGRMAFGFDPTGAAIGFWEPARHTGAQRFDEPGAMCWHEVNTRDGAACDAFYRGLFPFEQQQIGDGKNFDYTVWSLDNQPVAGRLQMTEEWKGIPPHWMTYFVVENCDASAKQVVELGGKLIARPLRLAARPHRRGRRPLGRQLLDHPAPARRGVGDPRRGAAPKQRRGAISPR